MSQLFDYIFQSRSITLLAAAIVTWLAFLLIGSPRFWLRSILFGYGSAFACAFFIAAFFYSGSVSFLDLTAGFIFEFTVLVVYAKLFSDVSKGVRSDCEDGAKLWLRWSIAFQLFAASPLFAIEGAGIFADVSRVTYIHESSLSRHLTYIGVLTAYVQAVLLASWLSSARPLGWEGYVIIATQFIISTISGSKGGVFLWVVAILALVDYRHIRIRPVFVLIALIVTMVALWMTVSVISEKIGIFELEFAEVAIARFFLNNDARALAIDFGGLGVSNFDFAVSSFRWLANMLGHPSNDPPLGLLLNELQTGVNTGNGPNASLIALIMYYSSRGYALLPVAVSCFGVVFVYAVVVSFRRILRSNITKVATSVIGIALVQLMSQDFLAFPLMVVAFCVAAVLFLFIDRKIFNLSARYVAAKKIHTAT